MYPSGQGSWARPGWGRRCAQALPSRLALRTCGSRYALVAWASPLWFALLAHGSGCALTTIKWIYLLQLNEFIYFALQKLWIHLQNLWILILNEFISKWIHLFKNEKRIKSLQWELNHVPTIAIHTATPPSTSSTLVIFKFINTNFIYDSHEWENDVINYYRRIHLRFCSRQQKKHMNNVKLK